MDGYIFMIALVGTICVFGFLTVLALGFFRLVGGRRSARTLSEEESKTLEELWLGLQKMEERIENLETILIHREKK